MRPKDGTPRGPAAGAVGAACGAPVGRTLTTQPKRRCNSARQRTVQPQAGSTGRRVCTETSTARTTRHATPALHQPTCEMLAQPGDWGPTSAGSAIQYCRGGQKGTQGSGHGVSHCQHCSQCRVMAGQRCSTAATAKRMAGRRGRDVSLHAHARRSPYVQVRKKQHAIENTRTHDCGEQAGRRMDVQGQWLAGSSAQCRPRRHATCLPYLPPCCPRLKLVPRCTPCLPPTHPLTPIHHTHTYHQPPTLAPRSTSPACREAARASWTVLQGWRAVVPSMSCSCTKRCDASPLACSLGREMGMQLSSGVRCSAPCPAVTAPEGGVALLLDGRRRLLRHVIAVLLNHKGLRRERETEPLAS